MEGIFEVSSGAGHIASEPKDPCIGNENPPVRGFAAGWERGPLNTTTDHMANRGIVGSPGGGKTSTMGTWPISKSPTKPEAGLDD